MGRPLHPYLPLIQPLMLSLMGHEKERLRKLKTELVQKNHQAGGMEAGFYYLDRPFRNGGQVYQDHKTLPYVTKRCEEEAAELYEEYKQVDRDEQKLRQALSVIVPRCQSLQDIRDVLPEIFIREVPQLRAIERTREPGFIVAEHPTLGPQFEKALEIADHYTVNKLLF